MPNNLTSHTNPGPHAVGLKQLTVVDSENSGRTIPVDVWYPAVASEDLVAFPQAEHPLRATHNAQQNLVPAAGRHPLVLFSHGNSGYPRQSTFLTTHLASWGVVTAAPEHVGNTFTDSLKIDSEEKRKQVHFDARHNRPLDVAAAARALLDHDGTLPQIDDSCIGALGHSYGGWTSLKMPGIEKKVRAVCGLAPASEPFVGRKAFEPGELPFAPSLPSLLIAGLDDVLVDVETSIKPLHQRLGQLAALVGVERADHFHFCDSVELLHGMHVTNKRPNQTRETKPADQLLSEAEIHAILRALVTSFFRSAFAAEIESPISHLTPNALTLLHQAVRRIA